MTDRSAPSPEVPFDDGPDDAPDDALVDLVASVLEQAEEIASLDAARAEAWASDVLALAAETSDADDPTALIAALRGTAGDAAATALAALSGLVDGVPEPGWDGARPAWMDAIGTSRCEEAWVLSAGSATSLAFRFVDAADDRHVITVDLVSGPPETAGEVAIGSGDLLDALEEEDAGIELEVGSPVPLAVRCLNALRATARPRLSMVVNGRLLLRRLASLTEVDLDPPVFVEDDIPEVPGRDPDDDAYALEILGRALGPCPDVPVDVVDALAALVAPTDLAAFTPAQRDAVLLLEWADWLGAVLGLVRSGTGTVVDGAAMVDFVNRCPEVTTTIPKADRARIEWAFDTIIDAWDELELLDDGRLTPEGLQALPAALHAAWSPRRG